MAYSWLFALLTLMAGPSKGKKVKQAKEKTIIGRFTAGDFADSDAEDTVDWDALSSDEDDEVKGPSIKEEEEEEIVRAPSPTIRYTRKRSTRASGVRFNESVMSPQWGQRQSPRIEDVRAPSQPSTTHEGESSQDTADLASICRDQQRLFAEQAKLVKDFERVSAELKDVKKNQNRISRMVKKIYFLIGCSSSVDLDSD